MNTMKAMRILLVQSGIAYELVRNLTRREAADLIAILRETKNP